jgi:hypothetical protein
MTVCSFHMDEHILSEDREATGLRYRIYAIGITLKVQFIGLSLINTFLYANILPWHLLGHAKMSVICFDLQFSRSTRPMTSFCIFIAYINTDYVNKAEKYKCLGNTIDGNIFNKHNDQEKKTLVKRIFFTWECRPSKLYFKIPVLWKYDDWSFRFHHFLENGRFYRENTCKCSPLVTKWQIILHFQCCFNNKYTPYFLR